MNNKLSTLNSTLSLIYAGLAFIGIFGMFGIVDPNGGAIAIAIMIPHLFMTTVGAILSCKANNSNSLRLMAVSSVVHFMAGSYIPVFCWFSYVLCCTSILAFIELDKSIRMEETINKIIDENKNENSSENKI